MKKSIKFLLMMLTISMLASMGFVQVNAESDYTNYYTVVEQVCQEPSLKRSSAVDRFAAARGESYTGKYGDQLNGVAKEVYSSMVKQFVTDGKTEQYTYTYNTPFTFKADVFMGVVMSNAEYSSIKKTISNALQMAQDAFLYDYPQLFWLRVFSSSYSISTSGNSSEGYIAEINNVTITPYETYLGASADISSYNSAVDNVLSLIDTTGSRYDILKSIHDYICEKSWYYSYGGRVIYTSEPFFLGDGGMVCEGYAEAFKILCDRLGIPCALIVGDASGPHMWNYVQMEDGRWYLVDATWDDGDNEISHTYFIANSNTIGERNLPLSEERTADGDFSETDIMIFAYPELSYDEYGADHTHRWQENYTTDKTATCTEKGSKSIHCQGCDEKKNITEIPATNHINKKKVAGQTATCEEAGYTEGYYCSDCGEVTVAQQTIPATGHTFTNTCDTTCNVCKATRSIKHAYSNSCDTSCNVCKATRKITHTYKSTTTKATLKKNGKQVTKCTVCGNVSKTTTIYYPKTIKLSETSYTYNGKAKKPTVTVKDNKGNTLKKDTDYTVKYSSGRKNPGKYTVTVTFKGKYEGTKKLTFTIKPKAVNLSKVTAGSKQLTATWKTVAAVTGYEVQYSTSSKFTTKTTKKTTVKSAKTKKITIKKLTKGKKYYVKVRAYKTVDGKKIYGAWSSVKSVKVK